MTSGALQPASCDTKLAEVPCFHHRHLQVLQNQARCSASSIILLACAVALKSYTCTESISLIFQGKDWTWHHRNHSLNRRNRVSLILQEFECDHTQPNNRPENAIQRYALSASALEDDRQRYADVPSIVNFKSTFPEVELLFAARQDPVTRRVILSCEYAARYSDWYARCILNTCRQVLESIVSKPHAQLGELELLNENGHLQYMDWNRNHSTFSPGDSIVQDMIAKHVHSTPLSPAVDSWDGLLSYAELDQASTKVASELSQLGVGPESIVALFFEKSVWNIVAVVAVLKAGGAFVSLDSSLPQTRLSHILGQVQAKVIICSKMLTERVLGLSTTVLTLDHLWVHSAPSPLAWEPAPVSPWSLAYLIFTSGSTGEPKGVMIEHSACAASVISHGQATGFHTGTRTVQYARHTFDASIAEILTTLAFGGCVVVPSEDERLNNITSVIRQKRVNWAFFTPSFIRLLDPSELPGLATIVLGGEVVGQDNIEKWAPGRNLIVGYGPTEATVFSNMHPVPHTAKAGVIGRGLENVSCWIADPDDPSRLSPLGATGELLLESPQLARGYLNFAEGEGPNKAFVRDPPWLAKHGRRARLYRTGDLCRVDENGVIHYEGRKDTQLKISGQRLEAAEVEYHLRAALGTKDVVVDILTRPTYGTEQHSNVLVAFFCLERTEEKSPGNGGCILMHQVPGLEKMIPRVEAEISRALPSWMCPSIYIPLSTLPLTPSGKSDVKTLRREAARLTPEQFYSFAQVEQTSHSEETNQLRVMRELWVEALGVHPSAIKANSNFFRVGGDSLAAIGLVTAARRRGLHMSVAQVFRSPLLHDLCQLPTQSKGAIVVSRPLEMVGDNIKLLDEIVDECAIGTQNVEYTIRTNDIEDAFPCTPLQEGLMALSSSTANSYLVQFILRLPANINVARLKMAWETVAKAHGILRTRIVDTSAVGARIHQVVVRENLAWNESFNLEEYLEMDLKQPSGFGAPLNRYAIVYDVSGAASRLVWTVHHAVTDGQSVGLTLQAVRDAFNGSTKPAEASFSSFIKYCEKMDREAAARYWSSVFQGAEFESFPKRASALPTIAGRQETDFARRCLPLPLSSTGATTTTILRAAWALVISRFSSTNDAVFGVTSSGRNAPFDGVESILGPTIATVPLRVNCDGKTTIRDLLQGVQMNSINMIPFEQMGLQNIARINANCRAASEFQSMMIVQPDVDMAVDGSPFTSFERPQDLDKFNSHAIMFECNLRKDIMHLNVNYDTQYLDHDQMERLLDYFEAALEFLTSGEEQCIEDFATQPTAKDLNKIREWNRQLPQTVAACVHHLFEEYSRTQPDAQAIFAWDGCLSFLELEKKASQLARVLWDLGVGPEKRVAYCFEKSMYTIVSMLAILKAGGAMVPLDPVPRGRVSFVVQNIGANVVVASATYAKLFADMNVEVVVVDSCLFDRLDDLHVAPFSSRDVQPHNAATVLFTSGSTGTPKGVIQEHQTLCSAAIAHVEGMQMTRNSSRILQFSAHVFDVSIIEIVNSFVLGLCICIPSDEERMDDLANFISRSQADWAFFTPSFARTLDPMDLSGMKTVCMGGEAMNQDSIKTWAGHVQLINAYGPCEGSVCTAANLSKEKFRPDSIGRGVNSLIWIVNPDNHDQLVPIGSVGELLIEGPSVARGYLGDTEKTANSFITNPAWMSNFEFNSDNTRRMYKTGDLGILNSDGSVSYLGRKDTQIKLRGQRVEPGEVECRLVEVLPSDSIVAVDAVSVCGSLNKSLVAFIQLGNQTCGFTEQKRLIDNLSDRLRLQLSSVLPAYMVPSHFVAVESIPFCSTGKLDRRTLKELASTLLSTEAQLTPLTDEKPKTFDLLRDDEEIALDISNRLADLLSGGDPLRAETLRGRNFNPFYAGMDSIQVISLSTFVRKTHGVSLPIQKYMNSLVTIRDIAEWIANGRHVHQHNEGIDLLHEVEVYDKSLAALPLSRAWKTGEDEPLAAPRNILLTGATGFLGNQLLAQMLQRQETCKVIALVRGRDSAHATQRLLSLTRGSSWWKEDYIKNVEVWHGDLSLPRLGLGDAEWSRLDGSSSDGDLIDAVVHNGAIVNWMADYRALTPANILSTVNLLAAVAKATTARPVRFTYVSGGHLSTSPDNIPKIAQELKTYPPYSQTKFVAELLVTRYAQRLAQAGYAPLVSIVKPGLIMGSSADGISNTDDYLWRVTASAIDIGLYDEDERDHWIAAAGVDLVARVILDNCFHLESNGGHPVVRKILHGLTLGEYWDIVVQETGRGMEPTNAETWLRDLHDAVEAKGSTHRLWPVLHFLEDIGGKLGQPLGAMTTENQLCHQESVKKALRKSLQYLVATGYVDSSSTSSVNWDSASEPTLLASGSVLFSRTSATPVWDQRADSKNFIYGTDGVAKAVSVVVAPMRTPSPLSDMASIE